MGVFAIIDKTTGCYHWVDEPSMVSDSKWFPIKKYTRSSYSEAKVLQQDLINQVRLDIAKYETMQLHNCNGSTEDLFGYLGRIQALKNMEFAVVEIVAIEHKE